MIFNDYDETGHRLTAAGCRSSRAEDEAILSNLRTAYGAKVAGYSDQALVNAFDMFAVSAMFGNNDERFIEFLLEYSL